MNAKRIFILALGCAAAGSLGATARADDTQDTHFKIYGGVPLTEIFTNLDR